MKPILQNLDSLKTYYIQKVRQLAIEQDEVRLGEKIAILEEEMQKLVARSEKYDTEKVRLEEARVKLSEEMIDVPRDQSDSLTKTPEITALISRRLIQTPNRASRKSQVSYKCIECDQIRILGLTVPAALGSASVLTVDAANKANRAEQPGLSDEEPIDGRSVWKKDPRPTYWHTTLSRQELINDRDHWLERTIDLRNDMIELKKRKAVTNKIYQFKWHEKVQAKKDVRGLQGEKQKLKVQLQRAEKDLTDFKEGLGFDS